MGEYDLIPEDVPAPTPVRPLKEIIEEFSSRVLPSARVNVPRTTPESLYVGLRKTVKEMDLQGLVRVVKRKDKVYLVRRR